MGPCFIPFVRTLVLTESLIKEFYLRTHSDVKPGKFSRVFGSARILTELELSQVWYVSLSFHVQWGSSPGNSPGNHVQGRTFQPQVEMSKEISSDVSLLT